MEDAMNCFMLVVGVGGYLGLGTLNFIDSHRKCFKDGSGKTEFCLGFMWYCLSGSQSLVYGWNDDHAGS